MGSSGRSFLAEWAQFCDMPRSACRPRARPIWRMLLAQPAARALRRARTPMTRVMEARTMMTAMTTRISMRVKAFDCRRSLMSFSYGRRTAP